MKGFPAHVNHCDFSTFQINIDSPIEEIVTLNPSYLATVSVSNECVKLYVSFKPKYTILYITLLERISKGEILNIYR